MQLNLQILHTVFFYNFQEANLQCHHQYHDKSRKIIMKFYFPFSANIGSFIVEVQSRFTFMAITNATVAVDTFFVIR